jgi:hypothetical protein
VRREMVFKDPVVKSANQVWLEGSHLSCQAEEMGA